MDIVYVMFAVLIATSSANCTTLSTATPHTATSKPEGGGDWFTEWLASVDTCTNYDEAYAILYQNLETSIISCSPIHSAIRAVQGGSEVDWTEQFESTCEVYDTAFVDCVHGLTDWCADDVTAKIDEWIIEFRGRVCVPETTQVIPHAYKLVDYIDAIGIYTLDYNIRYIGTLMSERCNMADLPNPQEGDNIVEFVSIVTGQTLRCYHDELTSTDIDPEMRSLFMYYVYLFLPMGVEADQELIYTEFFSKPHLFTTTTSAPRPTRTWVPFTRTDPTWTYTIPTFPPEVFWFVDWSMSLTTCNNDNEAFGLIFKGQSELWKCLNIWFLIDPEETTPMYNVGKWREMLETNCRTYDSIFVQCVANITSLCGEERSNTIDSWVAEMRGRICEPGTTNILPAVDTYLTDLKSIEEGEIAKQFEMVNGILNDNCIAGLWPLSPQRGDDYVAFFTRMGNDIFQCFRVELSLLDIADIIKSYYLFTYHVVISVGVHIDSNLVFGDFNLVPRGDSRSTVKVFGDPHMDVYNRGLMTCGAPGSILYLKNRYVNITGINTAASEGSTATYMTEVHITFHNTSGILAEYWAGHSTLPDEFVGLGQSMMAGTQDVITLTPMPGNMVRLVYNISGIAIALRRMRHTYMLVARAADVVFGESTGLLIHGCRSSDVIDITEPTRRRKRNAACESVDEELRQFCRFDYGETGNKELAESINKVLYVEEKTAELDIQLGGAAEVTTVVTSGNTGASLTYIVILLLLVSAHILI